jgi:toxin ParE1/3/4
MSRVRWAPRARRELLSVGRYIARNDPDAALRCVEQLVKRMSAVAELPFTGRQVPEFGREDIREVLVRGYRIVYAVRKSQILVLAVHHERRLLRPDVLADAE